jgi:hypothetical protein
LQIAQSGKVDVGLKQAAVRDVSGNGFNLECLDRLVQLQEAILGAMKRAPDLVEAGPGPGADEILKRSKWIGRLLDNRSRDGRQIEIL